MPLPKMHRVAPVYEDENGTLYHKILQADALETEDAIRGEYVSSIGSVDEPVKGWFVPLGGRAPESGS